MKTLFSCGAGHDQGNGSSTSGALKCPQPWAVKCERVPASPSCQLAYVMLLSSACRALTPHMRLSLEQCVPGSAPLCPKSSHYPSLNREMMFSPARRPRPERRRIANTSGQPEAPAALSTKGFLCSQPQHTVAAATICGTGTRRCQLPGIQPEFAPLLRPNQLKVPPAC
jgi:hypothetical protein